MTDTTAERDARAKSEDLIGPTRFLLALHQTVSQTLLIVAIVAAWFRTAAITLGAACPWAVRRVVDGFRRRAKWPC